MFEIRVLTPDDAPAFWRLRLEALSTVPEAFGESAAEHMGTDEAMAAERLANGGETDFVVGAFLNGELLGTAGYYRDKREKRSHKGHIWGMYVAPDLRGQGAGEAMLTEVIRRARTRPGLRLILLSVSETQEAAQRLYLKMGFEPYGIERGALRVGDRFLDEHFLALTLY